MTIVRYEAGDTVPLPARYASVGHFGEPSGCAVWCEAGESLPPPQEGIQLCPPVWYVEVAEVAVSMIVA